MIPAEAEPSPAGTDPEPQSPAAIAEPSLADHIVESVDSLADFHKDHYKTASPLQRAIDRFTDALGRPMFVAALLIVVVGWLVAAVLTSRHDAEQSPFDWLQGLASVIALMVSVLILATQRREDQLADRRAQLTLQLALIADKKNAKIIALLEELRRDQPNIADRIDSESEDMSRPADTKAVLAEIEDRGVRDSAAP